MAIEHMLEHPVSLIKKAAKNYWYTTRFSGRHPYSGRFGVIRHRAPPRAGPWLRGYEVAVFQDFRTAGALSHEAHRIAETRPWHVSGFVFALPLIVIFSVRKVRRTWKQEPVQAGLSAYLLFSVLWVLLIVLFVEGTEGNRMRFSTEPYLLLLVFWLFSKSPGERSEQHSAD